MSRSRSFGGGRIQELLGVMLARMQPLEIGDPVVAADHRLAVDEKAGGAELAGRVDDAGIAMGPVVTAPGEKPHPLAVSPHHSR